MEMSFRGTKNWGKVKFNECSINIRVSSDKYQILLVSFNHKSCEIPTFWKKTFVPSWYFSREEDGWIVVSIKSAKKAESKEGSILTCFSFLLLFFRIRMFSSSIIKSITSFERSDKKIWIGAESKENLEVPEKEEWNFFFQKLCQVEQVSSNT